MKDQNLMKEWERGGGGEKTKQGEKKRTFSSHSYSSLVVSLNKAKENIFFATSRTHLHT